MGKRFAQLLIGLLMIGAVVPQVMAQQYARPASDIVPGPQFEASSNKNDPLWPMVDEVTPNDLTDYILSGKAASTAELGLSSVTDPVSGTGHIMRFRATRSGGTATGQLQLWQGTTQIATTGLQTIASQDVWQTFSHTLSAGEANAITDYAALSFRIISGSVGNNNELLVTWMELEVPSASAAAPTLALPTAVSIDTTAASLGGTISNDGGALISQHGTVWNTSPNPVTPTHNPSTRGNLVSAIPPAVPFSETRSPMGSGTQIYYRAYATNSEGTSYSPQGSFYTEPTQANGVNFTAVTSNSMTVNWTAGGGDGRLVVMSTVATPDTPPADGAVYTANTSYGSGTPLGNGFVIADSTGTSVPVDSLTQNTEYFVAVYEYAGSGNDIGDDQGINYQQDTPATGNWTTDTVLVAPTLTLPTAVTITDTAADIGGTITNDGGALISQHGTVWNTTGTPVTPTDSPSTLGALTAIPPAPSEVISETRSPLNSGTQIFYRAYATNSVNTSYSPQGSFFTEPATQATIGTFGAVTANSIEVNWTPGSGAGSLVVMRAAQVPEPPVDGDVYIPNSNFNSGHLIGANTRVVATTGSTVNVTGLASNTTYFVAIYEYAGTLADSGVDQGINYQQDAPAAGSEQTAIGQSAPVVDTPTAVNITHNAADLGGTIQDDGNDLIDDHGTYWNDTGTTPVENPSAEGAAAGPFPFSFSTTRNPLPSQTRIYYRAYATNTPGTSNSALGSFYTEPATQANGVNFTAITSNSMTINWTAGSGDGSLVVMRADSAPAGPGPLDGTVYTGDLALGAGSSLDGGSVVFAGSGSSAIVTGLTQDTVYHVAVYEYAGSGNDVGDDQGINYQQDTPATGNGTTDTATNEPTDQASNIVMRVISSKSLVFNWTPGSDSDGSIVVMSTNSLPLSPPTDGDDYPTWDPDFSSPPPTTAAGDFVVYVGSDDQAWVYGLSSDVTYYIAVFAYGGSGAQIDYLTSIAPAEKQQITDGPAAHNYDNNANCADCHNHGGVAGSGWVPRGVSQKDVCSTTCHKPGGLASNKLNFDMHFTPKYGTLDDDVDCGSCHEIHKPGTTWNSTSSIRPGESVPAENLSYIRSNVQKYISGITTADAVFHGETDKALEAATTTEEARGLCQSCHTETNFYRNNLFDTNVQCHKGGASDPCSGNVDCSTCHKHEGAFAGAGGDCKVCHTDPQDGEPGTPGSRRAVVGEFSRASSHIDPAQITAADCEVCHAQEPTDNAHEHGLIGAATDKKVTLWNADSHNTSYQSLTGYGDIFNSASEAGALTPHCLSCHDSNGALAEVGNETTPFTGSLDVFDVASTWTGSSHESAALTCLGDGDFGCHASGHGSEKLNLHAPALGAATSPHFTEEEEGFCFNCHSSTGISTIDIETFFNGTLPADGNGGTNYRVTASGGAPVNQRHDVLWADQLTEYSGGKVECTNCHRPHQDNTANPVSNPDTGAALPDYDHTNAAYAESPGTDIDPLNPLGQPSGGRTEPDYIQFCTACHDGPANQPAGVTMSTSMVDIASAYAGDQHGKVGSAGGSGNGFLKYPWRPSDPNCQDGGPWTNCPELSDDYAALNCTTCHGAHGSKNIFNLKSRITVAGVQMKVGGWTGDTLGTPDSANASADRTEYILPRTGGVQVDHDWGAWCTFCHQLEGHNKSETTACAGSHTHGQKF